MLFQNCSNQHFVSFRTKRDFVSVSCIGFLLVATLWTKGVPRYVRQYVQHEEYSKMALCQSSRHA